MADRTVGKAKKQAKKAPVRSSKGMGRVRSEAAASPANLAAECVRLRKELEAAQAQLKVMEAQRKELLDRINWAIDSLASLHDT